MPIPSGFLVVGYSCSHLLVMNVCLPAPVDTTRRSLSDAQAFLRLP